MSVTYVCPHCKAALRTGKPIRPGRAVPCPKCSQSFVPVPDDADDAPAPIKLAADPPKPAPRPKPAPPPPEPEKKKSRFDDDEDDGPAQYAVRTESAEEIAKAEANKVRYGELRDKFAKSARGPAIAQLVGPTNFLTAEGFLTGVAGLGMFVYGMWPLVFTDAPPGEEETQEAIINMMAGTMLFIWGGLICVGASKMQDLQSYTWAMVGAVMGILPLGAGILALLVLRKKEVIAGFEEAELGDDPGEGGDEKDDEDEEEEEEEERPRKRRR